MFEAPEDRRIGEVWFVDGDDLPLLAKYIFTSERLSIQVHPNDEQARARGLPHGKNECWYILDADADARLGLGLKKEVGETDLRNAALDGSIVDLVKWRSVRAGDFIFVPAGTIHAIGSGVSLLEFQQNSDVTYRLYDYGRPRELHLDDGVAVSSRAPFPEHLVQHVDGDERRTLVDGPHFTLVLTDEDALQDRMRWVLPLDGEARAGDSVARAGECLLVRSGETVEGTNGRMLIGAMSTRS